MFKTLLCQSVLYNCSGDNNNSQPPYFDLLNIDKSQYNEEKKTQAKVYSTSLSNGMPAVL